ncbi:zona pellucida-binding protein 1 isoform X2 [Numida meleagris]|uniref:zona pellucida-binding protein 1 isoform X2 n=1 Tax=Numida meleagris TaxID=8996 RepID=UPI000B3DBB3D|nr:zona pellucida-binding protein 1 isoform X2 [Numida meleagris]
MAAAGQRPTPCACWASSCSASSSSCYRRPRQVAVEGDAGELKGYFPQKRAGNTEERGVSPFCTPEERCACALAVQCSRSAESRSNSLKIVGSVLYPVKVYVKLDHSSPHILCVTNHLRNSELIDPVFRWNGPGGYLSSENSSVEISPTGTLILSHFSSDLSGVYTCSLVYKLIAAQPDKRLTIKYLIYAYSDPQYYYELTVQYHAAPCNSFHNTSFGNMLLQILRKLVADLSCEVTLIKSECHHVKMQKGGLQNEIFFTFSVACLDTENNRLCPQSGCDASHRLHKAKHLIERFFKQEVEIRKKSSEPLPEIYYVEGTLQMVWVDSCYPGYGVSAVRHPDCPECCVICSPGSYNPSNGIHCLQCDTSLRYGATNC